MWQSTDLWEGMILAKKEENLDHNISTQKSLEKRH